MGRSGRHRRGGNFLARHSLSIVVAGLVAALIVVYRRSDQNSHIGTFYGNAVADWLGTLMIVIATKYLRESRSAESRQPHPRGGTRVRRLIARHSLTIALVVSGAAWAIAFGYADPAGKSGQVLGSIVSEWTQLLGLVLITKYAREAGSKEGD